MQGSKLNVDAIDKDKSPCDWKRLGNDSFHSRKYDESKLYYSRGINYYSKSENDDVLCSLLNNRALCYMKLNKFKLAYIDIISSKYLNPNLFKTWYRQIVILNKMQCHYVANIALVNALKSFPDENAALMKLKNKLKLLDSSLSRKKVIIDSEWDILGVIVFAVTDQSLKIKDYNLNEDDCKSESRFKEIGNKQYYQGNYQNAIEYYTKGLLADYRILSALLSNRCAALIHLEEYKKAFKDATISVIINTKNMKGWQRRTITADKLNLHQIADAISKKYRDENKKISMKSNWNNNDNLQKLALNQEEKNAEFANMGTVSADNISAMINLLPPAAQKKLGLNDMAKFHELYPCTRDYPKGADIGKCRQILYTAYQNARAIGLNELELLSGNSGIDKYQMEPRDIPNRLASNHPDRIMWYEKSKQGDIDINYYNIHESMGGYFFKMFHSFSNAPYQTINLFQGETHIAVGFCDLGLIAKCNIKQSKNDSPNNQLQPNGKTKCVRFVGVDSSSYTIAKSYVINEMCKHKDISNESLLEVFYSSTWTMQTQLDFHQITAEIVHNHQDRITTSVIQHIKHWNGSKGVSLQQTRKKWFDSFPDNCASVGAFNSVNDMLDYAEYVLSGDITRDDMNIIGGNITMFDNISECPKKALNESVFQILEFNKLFHVTWKQCKSLKKTIKTILLNNIDTLKTRIINEEIIIEFINDKLTFDNKTLIQKLSSMAASTVSWSNCIDYMHPLRFHNIAKLIGKDCFHFAYSMNWRATIKGTSIVDFDLQTRKKTARESKDMIKTDISEIYKFPPISHIMDWGSYGLSMKLSKKWVQWFLSDEISKTFIHYKEENLVKLRYNPLHKDVLIIYFHWRYDEELKLNDS